MHNRLYPAVCQQMQHLQKYYYIKTAPDCLSARAGCQVFSQQFNCLATSLPMKHISLKIRLSRPLHQVHAHRMFYEGLSVDSHHQLSLFLFLIIEQSQLSRDKCAGETLLAKKSPSLNTLAHPDITQRLVNSNIKHHACRFLFPIK